MNCFQCQGRAGRHVSSREFFVWLVLVAAALAANAQPADGTGDETRIFLRGRVIETGAAPEALPQALTRTPTAGEQLYLIQFSGPIQEQWLRTVEEQGKVEIVTYLPTHAYLIWTDGPTVGKLQDLSRQENGFLQWAGPYQPAYSLHPELSAATTVTAEDRKVTVQFVDHPGVDASIAAVKAKAVEVLRDTWTVGPYRNLRIVVSSADLAEIAALPDVINVEPFLEPTLTGERQCQIMANQLNAAGSQPAGPGYLAWLAARGFDTNFDFAVDVTDDGFDRGQTGAANVHQDFLDGGGNSRIAYVQQVTGAVIDTTAANNRNRGGHGTLNTAVVGGFNNTADTPGTDFEDAAGYQYGLGIAPFVRLGSSKILDPWSNPDYTELINSAYLGGARISNNSWGMSCDGCCSAGTLGDYTAASQEYDSLVRDARPAGASDGGQAGNQEMVIVFAASNLGSCPNEQLGNVGTTAKNTIVVGAGENGNPAGTDGCNTTNAGANDARDVIGFSSRGPTLDNRIRPDLMGPGTHVYGAASQSATYDADSVCSALGNRPRDGNSEGFDYFPAGQTLYTWSTGTSHSAPAISGGAALLRQWFLDHGRPPPSPAMTKAYLTNSATWMTGVGANDTLPSNTQGMGRMNLERAFDDVPRLLEDQGEILDATGDTFTLTGTIADATEPFRVTLAWTDAPGSTVGNAWVNDLDLEVSLDDGSGPDLYRGNVLVNAQSQTGGAADRRNNTESVWLPAGTTGNFTITVRAFNVAGDGVPNVGDATDQDFALVVYNGERPRTASDIVLALDLSGSMLSAACPGCASKLDVLKDAVEIFVQLWSTLAIPGDRLGATYFRTGVTELDIGGVQLLPVVVGNNAEDIVTHVRGQGTISTNLTAMGGGLDTAITRLADATHQRNVILLTDGMQNVNPMVRKIDDSPPPGAFHMEIETTPPTLLDATLGRKISTIAIGSSDPWVALLNDVADKAGGVTKATSAPDVELRRFYVEELVDVLRGFSPQLIDYRHGTLAGDSGSETFGVNRTAKQLVLKLSWRRGDKLDFRVKKGRVDVTRLGTFTTGGFYRIFSIDLPARLGNQVIEAEGDWTMAISGTSGTSYEAAAIADEAVLEYDFSVGEGDHRVGGSIPLQVEVSVDGSPMTGAKVSATVYRPGNGIGTLLSTTRTPSFDSLKAEDKATGGQKKLQILLEDREFYRRLVPTPLPIVLANNGDGSYSASFDQTTVPGSYRVVFEVKGKQAQVGEFRRTETLSALVEFGTADYSASDAWLYWPRDTTDKDPIALTIRPRDQAGNYLGPDYGHRIQVSVSPGAAGRPQDLLDGRYRIPLSVYGPNPEIEIVIMDRPCYQGPLSEIRPRYALSWHVGRTLPLGDFDILVDDDQLFELDFEWPLSDRRSLIGVLGLYRFDPSFDVLGGTVYLRGYRPRPGGFRLFGEVGAGLYDPENLDLAFGLSAGFGVDRGLNPQWRGEVGVDAFHLFNEGDDIDFLAFKIGLRRRF